MLPNVCDGNDVVAGRLNIDVPLTKRGTDSRRTQRRVLALLLHLGIKRDGVRHEVASLSRMALKT